MSLTRGYSVKVFESHYLAGGCCHMFDHRDKDGGLWKFEVGPSIWEGLDRPTGNPLRMVRVWWFGTVELG